MIDLETKTITLLGKTEPIESYQVWWMTAKGLSDTIPDDTTEIRAIPVAVSKTLYEIL